jgi:zinc protease
MKRIRSVAAALALLAAFSAPAQAQQDRWRIPVQTRTLDNGLTVVVSEDRSSPTVGVSVVYHVGMRLEPENRTGFAHLFEHLMFQGSENVGAGDHFQLVERAGGNLNASITEDRTNYFQTMPPERMNLALWLESDRLRSLQITDENMRREIEVVKEERRQGVDNSPYGTSYLQAAFYAAYDSTSCFPYAHSVIGSMEDLTAASLEDVREWFRTYYGPNNAVISEGVARYPNTVLADWYSASAYHPEFFVEDGVHLQIEGQRVYAHLISRRLEPSRERQ